jgi:hypothetical protein
MKKTVKHISFLLGFLLMALSPSCTEGLGDPETDPKEKFIGTWTVREESPGIIQNYTSNVSKDPANTSRVLIGNIFNLDAPIPALVTGNSLTLVNSNISGFEIKGTGLYSGGSFVLNYTSNDGSGSRQVKATYSN